MFLVCERARAALGMKACQRFTALPSALEVEWFYAHHDESKPLLTCRPACLCQVFIPEHRWGPMSHLPLAQESMRAMLHQLTDAVGAQGRWSQPPAVSCALLGCLCCFNCPLRLHQPPWLLEWDAHTNLRWAGVESHTAIELEQQMALKGEPWRGFLISSPP